MSAPLSFGYKTLSYLEPLIARAEARHAGADESLVLNTSGTCGGAATANLFLVHDTTVRDTPD